MQDNLRKLLLISFIFSGMAALIYEVTWIRPLQFILGSTIYTISIIFSSFMGGLALGSWIISKYIEKIKDLPYVYALFETAIGIYGILLLSIFNILPKIYNSIYNLHGNFYLFEFTQLVLVFIVLLIPTTLMGATFPVIAKFYAKEKIGKAIGEIYAANNLGAIIGSFTAGFILIPFLGITTSIIIAGTINLIIAGIILFKTNKEKFKKLFVMYALFFILLASFAGYNIQSMHSGGFYRPSEIQENFGQVIYYEEGLHATITVREHIGQVKALYINGKPQGSYEILDLRVNFLLAYLPEILRPESKNALIIGLGTGTTSGQISQIMPTTTVEIEKEVIPASDYFTVFNLNVLENPNHTLIIGDGRNYLLKNSEKYDIISQEPSDPWQSFSSALYSKEFFELVKEDLSEKGVYAHWIPIYTMSEKDFQNFYKTFREVFPYQLAFANIKSNEDTPAQLKTSEIILIGSKSPIESNEKEIEKGYNLLPESSKQSLNSIKLSSGKDFHNLILFTEKDLEGYAQSAETITDDRPLLEFSTAKNVLTQNPEMVLQDINKYMEEKK